MGAGAVVLNSIPLRKGKYFYYLKERISVAFFYVIELTKRDSNRHIRTKIVLFTCSFSLSVFVSTN